MYAEKEMPTKGVGVKRCPDKMKRREEYADNGMLTRKYRLNYHADKGMPIRINEMRNKSYTNE
jgi:hypothetical protein